MRNLINIFGFVLGLMIGGFAVVSSSHSATFNNSGAIVGYGPLTFGAPVGATGPNSGGWTAGSSGAGSAGLNMGSLQPVYASPPSGSPISPALATVALGLAAGPVIQSAVDYAPTITNPAAALTVAATMMTTAGWMLVGTPAGAPLMLAGAAVGLVPAACAAVSGCRWLQAMGTAGITLGSNGLLTNVSGGDVVAYPGHWTGSFPSISALFAHDNGFYAGWSFVDKGINATVAFTDGHGTTFYCQNIQSLYNGSDMGTNSVCPSFVSYATPTPATNADIVAAINATTGATNQASNTASQNAAAADMINLALLGALNTSNLNAQSLEKTVASAFVQISETTDNMGNTIQQLSRTISTIPAVASGPIANVQNPLVTQKTQSVTVTNDVATSTATTTPTALSPLVATVVPPPPTADMCLQHPEILACADITQLNDLPAVTPLAKDLTFSALSPVSVGGIAICPLPFVIPPLMVGATPVVVDLWRSPCSYAQMVNPFVRALATIAAMYILMGAFKNG